jgi:hypothetical protein
MPRGNSNWRPGMAKPEGSGRKAGSRNRLSTAFIDALLDEFEEGGAAAIRIVRHEQPGKFLEIISRIIPLDVVPPDFKLTVFTGVPRHGEVIEHDPTISTQGRLGPPTRDNS